MLLPSKHSWIFCLEVAHSASDNLEFTRQLQNYQMFHELNKVQRQILHPVTAAVNDTVPLATNMKSSRECPVEQPVRTSNCSSRGQVIRQFNDVHLPGTMNWYCIDFEITIDLYLYKQELFYCSGLG